MTDVCEVDRRSMKSGRFCSDIVERERRGRREKGFRFEASRPPGPPCSKSTETVICVGGGRTEERKERATEADGDRACRAVGRVAVMA